MKPAGPIDVVELFPPLSQELLATLRGFTPAAWDLSTVCGDWTVKDVAAHLLGGNLGRLWKPKMISTPPGKPLGFNELLAIINRENAQWVEAARRISPEILIELLELTDRRLYEHFQRLDPHALARITVAWVSDDLPPNWLDIAREYTEKWLHQQHIREAAGLPLLTGRAFLYPVLDAFVRGLPRAFQGIEAEDGAAITVEIEGEAGGEWTLVREKAEWRLYEGRAAQAACRVRLDQDLAWRVFTRGISPAEALPRVQIEGDRKMGEQVLQTVSIMA